MCTKAFALTIAIFGGLVLGPAPVSATPKAQACDAALIQWGTATLINRPNAICTTRPAA